ncbi:hypothetical protein DFP72DRAFT_1170767 [Ephemerocybe angulata]|uniref:Uncharacterized protein n=1 Tax=Ephemerocybe angulata TaxID=980116 RepID=A0A8H6M3Y9_9AGAR|nr:hypothetical protein DFP72DRAFT_1170767 [Tulosesus angulatus]
MTRSSQDVKPKAAPPRLPRGPNQVKAVAPAKAKKEKGRSKHPEYTAPSQPSALGKDREGYNYEKPLEDFFSRYPGFKYDSMKESPPDAFRRLISFLHWENGDPAMHAAYASYWAAVTNRYLPQALWYSPRTLTKSARPAVPSTAVKWATGAGGTRRGDEAYKLSPKAPVFVPRQNRGKGSAPSAGKGSKKGKEKCIQEVPPAFPLRRDGEKYSVSEAEVDALTVRVWAGLSFK